MVGGPNGPGLTPQKALIFEEKMLRLFEVFLGKNSSPIFSTQVRARASSPCTFLVGTIYPYNFYYQHFSLRTFLSEIFAGPFHRAKTVSQGRTVLGKVTKTSSAFDIYALKISMIEKRPTPHHQKNAVLPASALNSELSEEVLLASLNISTLGKRKVNFSKFGS